MPARENGHVELAFAPVPLRGRLHLKENDETWLPNQGAARGAAVAATVANARRTSLRDE